MSTPRGPEPGSAATPSGVVLCQSCGAANAADRDLCVRCHQKLLVLSGPVSEEDATEIGGERESDFSLDEHLLERVSILEEALKRTAESLGRLVSAVQKQEKNLLVSQTGFATLRELLERRRLLGSEEWSDLWQSKMEAQLAALEKRERFVAVRERIAGLYSGDRRKAFLGHLDDAEYALFAFDVDRAREGLEQAFKLDRGNYELALLLGETAFNEGRTEDALDFFARVLDARPEQFEALVYSGVIRHERGELEEAERVLQRAVALFPDAFLPNFSYGAVSAARGELARAIAYLERACELDPVPQALYLLGNSYFEAGQVRAAIDRLQEAVRLDPAFEEAHYLLGLAYLDRRWTRKALAEFREAQRLNPRRLRYQDLVRFLSGARAPLPRVGAAAAEAMEQAEAHARRGDAERALAAGRRAIAAEPENPGLLMAHALVCLGLGETAELEAAARRVLELDPGEMLRAAASATLIAALRGQGKYREGNAVGRALLDGAETSFTRTIAFYEMAYNLAEMEDDLEEALDCARRSLAEAPDELKQFPLAALGWVHYKRGELEPAVDYLERSNELGPSPTTLTHLGMALLAAGEEKRARAAFGRARELEPRVGALEERMMECLRDAARIHERVQRKPKP